MISTLRYGTDSAVDLQVPETALLTLCDAPRGVPLDAPKEAVRAALQSPLGFPPLGRAVVPGDRVAIALDHGVPQAAALVAAVVESLLESGAAADDITLLQVMPEAGTEAIDPRSALSAALQGEINLVTHNPADKRQLSYLAANAEGAPIYLNRALCDADLVLPIGCLRSETALAYYGVHDALFPAFSDRDTIARFQAATSAGPAKQRQREESDEVAWLLGVPFTIQVVPGAGDQILHVLAGDPREVFRRGKELSAEAWSYSVPGRASLVVAAIEGTPGQQTWENVARALAAASRAVADNGAIALCTDLAIDPGPAVRRVTASDNPTSTLRKVRKEHQPDLLPATQLALALDRAKVYLLSRLDEAVVEGLGVAHVGGADEIARLAGRHASCIVLSNAQHVVATPADES